MVGELLIVSTSFSKLHSCRIVKDQTTADPAASFVSRGLFDGISFDLSL